VLKKLDYPIMGFVLGFILGGLVDKEFLKSYLMFADDLPALFSRPAFIVLLSLNVISIAWSKLAAAFESREKGIR
jgi:TctA family transporter